ncbi:MAG TPA: hypothetical protein VJ885_09010 [Thermoanaerobaculia bacterium]|nr:hypothetical protein [Thermoanaerobaculia bacterium]
MPPRKSSQPEFIRHSEKLLSAIVSNPTLLPDLSDLTVPLEQTITEIKVLSGRQETLKADKQKTTQDLRAAFDRARDQAIRIRAAVKSRLGPRTEKLVEFQVAPIRPRTRTTKKKPVAVTQATPATTADPSMETA